MPQLDQLEPQEIISHFLSLSAIPRGSTHEKAVSDWVLSFASGLGLTGEQDELGNVIVRKPGTPGMENSPTVILHGHLDMVCEAADGVKHDFLTEPIRVLVENDWLTADGTSLGADNGIGVAYILALLSSSNLPHPPLEAVLTVMEEKGKVGAAHVDVSGLNGTRMIDFNWITDTQILAGCGGDLTVTIDVPADWEDKPTTHDKSVRLGVRKLVGGHCEFDIHRERANAIAVLSRALRLIDSVLDIRVAAPHGGAQNNVIPSYAEAVLTLSHSDHDTLTTIVHELQETLQSEYSVADPDICLEIDPAPMPVRVFSPQASARLAACIALVPNGVLSWSLDVPGIVECSNNLGTLRETQVGAQLMTTITAGVTSRKHEVRAGLQTLSALTGGQVHVESYGLDAPELPFNRDSALLAHALNAYEAVNGEPAEVHISNCSLELGMFHNKISGLDTVSLGTELRDLHSPNEKVRIDSIGKTWAVIKDLMPRLAT